MPEGRTITLDSVRRLAGATPSFAEGVLVCPTSGEGVAANAALADAPETVNAAPEAAGWFAKVKLANPAELDALMDRAAYEAYLQTL